MLGDVNAIGRQARLFDYGLQAREEWSDIAQNFVEVRSSPLFWFSLASPVMMKRALGCRHQLLHEIRIESA